MCGVRLLNEGLARNHERSSVVSDLPCKDEADIFGAGRSHLADPDEASKLCKRCPVRDSCLESFAFHNRPEHVPFNMTVSGLSNDRLRAAMKMIREKAA